MVGRDAVDEQRADAHLLEAPRGAAELVALGPAPVLAVDAAHAVAAAAEATATPAGRSARSSSTVSNSDGRRTRQRLDEHEVGRRRLVGEQAREEADRLAAVGRVDVGVERERDRGGARARPRPAAVTASRRPRRAMSIQCTGAPASSHSRGPSAASADARPHVFVEMTSQPVAT